MILENRGYSLDTYSDPAAALLKFKTHYYDLLVLDYRMPDLNGLELFARMREMDPTARALLLSANHEQFIEGKQIEGRYCLKVITKPISNEKLLAEVDSLLNQHITSSVSLENHVGKHKSIINLYPKMARLRVHRKSVHSVYNTLKQCD